MVERRGRAGVAAALGLLAAATAAWAGDDAIFGDGFETGESCAWQIATPTCPGFAVTPPEIEVESGSESVRCYYFRTANGALAGAHRLRSQMDPAVMYMALYTSYDAGGQPVEIAPPGTLAPCSTAIANPNMRLLYLSQQSPDEVVLPTDDGASARVGIELLTSQPAVLLVHVANDTVDPISVDVSFAAATLPAATPFTRAATLFAIDTQLAVQDGGTVTSTHTCAVPPSVKFWWFSTMTHGFATLAEVRNGASPIVQTTDWDFPEVQTFSPPSFYDFGPGNQITYSCTWENNSGHPINFGESYSGDENCNALTYFFPATVPRTCVNNILLP